MGLFFAFQEPGKQDFAPLSAVIEQQRRRMSAWAAWSAYFDDVDVFLCPVNFTAAFPHDPRPFDQRSIATEEGERPYTDQPFWITHASLPGLPALTAPAGRTPEGLPIGVQIIGPLYEEDTATYQQRDTMNGPADWEKEEERLASASLVADDPTGWFDQLSRLPNGHLTRQRTVD